MIEVYKTNVRNKTDAKRIINLLEEIFSDAKMNFDLHDCDKILRIDGIGKSNSQSVINDLNKMGFSCEVLV